MHEFAICDALIRQSEEHARTRSAAAIARIVVRIGPLSGVEPELLRQAFEVVRTGTLAAEATLELGVTGVKVRCRSCKAESEVEPQKLVCASCGDWRTTVIEGDELLLASLELITEDEASPESVADEGSQHV